MSSCSRRTLLLSPLALMACGFEPVYGPGGTGTRLNNKVTITPPRNQNSYLLVQRLEERLGRGADPIYTLSLSLNLRQEGLGEDEDGTINRYNIIGIAGYSLTDPIGTSLASGTVNSFTGYSASGNTAVTLAAERDARERLMVILADQMTARLLAAPLPAL